MMYLEQGTSLVRFARTDSDFEQKRWFLSSPCQSLWTGNLLDWMLNNDESVTGVTLRPVMGRWENLAPDLGMSQRPVPRPQQAQGVQAAVVTLPYTKGRCHQWTQNAAVAELVQNWKDEIDAGAERCGHSSSQVKVSYSQKRDRSHFAVSTYHAVLCDTSDEFTLLGTIEVREESNNSLSVTLTNFSDKMFVEMLWDGWAGKDKEQGKRRGQFGDGLQSAVVVLSRDSGVDLKIFSSGHVWSFDWSFPSEVAKAHGKEALRVTTKAWNHNLIGFLVDDFIPIFRRFHLNRPSESVPERALRLVGFAWLKMLRFDCGRDTRIKVMGLQKQAFDEKQFLFLCPPYEVISSSSGEILLSEQFQGCMYVREMRVLQHEKRVGVISNRQGLNIASQNPGQSRDRIGFLSDAAKNRETVTIWTNALAQNNRSVAELLYNALEDRRSLEAQAFHLYASRTSEILPGHAKLLADVCSARHPKAFPILETDYKGHKIVTQKLKKQAKNISPELFEVLRKSPDFKTPEEYWKMQQEELARSAERITWTDKYHHAVTICQEALRTQVSYEVSYDSDPGDDILLQLSYVSHEQKLIVRKVCPDGPASRAFIGVNSELVGIDFPTGTERINAQNLKCTSAFWVGRPLSYFVKSQGWRRQGSAISAQTMSSCAVRLILEKLLQSVQQLPGGCMENEHSSLREDDPNLNGMYPFKLQFLLRPANLSEDQFSLVCRDELEVPFVALPGPRGATLEHAKFVINAASCKFHSAKDSHHCPYFATQGVCFCGVDHLLTAILEEMEKSFNVHLNKIQRQWVDVEKSRLLRQHEKVYKLNKPQAEGKDGSQPKHSNVVLRGVKTEAASEVAVPDEMIQKILRSYVSGSVENLSEEERKILAAVKVVVAEVEAQNWEKRHSSDPQAALLGSQLIQFALAVCGNIKGLPVKGQLDVYRDRLATHALAGSNEAGQQVESRLGRAAMPCLAKFSSLLQPLLRTVHVPPGNQSVQEILDNGIEGVGGFHRFREAEAFGTASAEDKAFLQMVQNILQKRNRTHFSQLVEEIRRSQVAIPSNVPRNGGWSWLTQMLREWHSVFTFEYARHNDTNPVILLASRGTTHQ
eukprot:Skav216771  [mRNA]  locus=scaffold3378:44289:50185:- [translate_table: standard]